MIVKGLSQDVSCPAPSLGFETFTVCTRVSTEVWKGRGRCSRGCDFSVERGSGRDGPGPVRPSSFSVKGGFETPISGRRRTPLDYRRSGVGSDSKESRSSVVRRERHTPSPRGVSSGQKDEVTSPHPSLPCGGSFRCWAKGKE